MAVHKMIQMLLSVLVLLNLEPVHSDRTDFTPEDVTTLRAIPGQDSRVPCGLGKVFLDGPEAYVQWTKNDREFLYRYPPDTPGKKSKYYDRIGSMPCIPGTTCDDETALLIKSTSAQDVAMYRCRVFYQFSPSEDYRIDLRLVAPPSKPRLYDRYRMDLTDSFVGPVELGSNFTLLCEVKAEDPETLVYWRRNGLVIERGSIVRPGMLQAVVHVYNVTRSDFEATYECLANNADVAEPLTSTVFVKINLPPISIEIRLDNKPDFEVGVPRVVDCVVIGSVPPPIITWYLGQKMLRSNIHKELNDGNFTVSTMSLVLSRGDNKQSLVCKAHNPQIPNIVLQDKVTLNVGYDPTCVSTKKLYSYREGITITCSVKTSLEAKVFQWDLPGDKIRNEPAMKVAGHKNEFWTTLSWLAVKGNGLLCCRSFDSSGRQIPASDHSITFEGPPQAPKCSTNRIYPDMLTVDCKVGWDGGSNSTTHLEVMYSDGKLLLNKTDTNGHFMLYNVASKEDIIVSIYSSNKHGRSYVTTSDIAKNVLPPNEVENPTSRDRSWNYWPESIIIFVASSITLLVFSMCLKMIIERKKMEMEIYYEQNQDGSFHREPDFVREASAIERGPVNHTVWNSFNMEMPLQPAHLMVEYKSHTPPDVCEDTRTAYYV